MRGLQDPAGESLIPPPPPTSGSSASGSSGSSGSGPATDRARHRRLVAILTVVALLTYAADQLSKVWAVATLTHELPRSLVGSFLRLQLIRNPGAAFSLGTGSTWLLTVIAVVVLVVIVRVSRRLGSTGWAWAFGLLLGGALGNLTDRLVRDPGLGRGYVVDFIAYGSWFIGNVADIAIVSAAVLIALLAVRGTGVDGRREGDPAASVPVPTGARTDQEDPLDEPRTQPDQHDRDQRDQPPADPRPQPRAGG